jgi:uncharacterized protein
MDLQNNSALSAIKRRYGLKTIAVFGSVARGDDRTDSDIDIAAEFHGIDLFELVGIKEELERALGRKVDIVCMHPKMNPYLRKRIEAEAIYV